MPLISPASISIVYRLRGAGVKLATKLTDWLIWSRGAGWPTATVRRALIDAIGDADGRAGRTAHARTYVDSRDYPVVVKADGLAAGKGVIVCKDTPEAVRAIDRIMVKEEFGPKVGRQIVVEKRLEGEELSLLALVAGRSVLLLPPTQDHKAVFDGDTGPNTGGMGTYCPAPVGTPELLADAEETCSCRSSTP